MLLLKYYTGLLLGHGYLACDMRKVAEEQIRDFEGIQWRVQESDESTSISFNKTSRFIHAFVSYAYASISL